MTHRDLHSFPTRRSSDLDYGARQYSNVSSAEGKQQRIEMVAAESQDPAAARGSGRRSRVAKQTVVELRGIRAGATLYRRSEEHTSELQSLRHLVCRLLLE